MKNTPHRAGLVAGAVMASSAVMAFGTPAVADDEESDIDQPPGYEAPAVPDIDAEAAGLKLGDGATLAEPRVIDIKFVTENLGGGATEPGEEEPEATGSSGPGGEEPNGGDDSGAQREERSNSQHKFTLQTDVLFDEGSAVLSEEAREALQEVAAAIDEYQPTTVNIFGFTDNQGSYESGIPLSQDRARNTREVLLELIEDPSTIAFNVRGYSEDYPLYDNSTEEGRQRNRRVEISWPTTE